MLSESQGLARRGHDVKLLCPPDSRICAEAPAWQVEAVALPIAAKRLAGVKALAGWFRRNHSDVVSTHSSTDAWLSALALAALGRPFPMVRTRHISAPVPRNPLSRWLYTRATARIVTAGESLRKELIERNGFPAARIESVPTGVDAERFRPGDKLAARNALHLPPSKTLIGIVATLRSWKGHRFLVEAVAGLPEAVGLVIVGDGPQREPLQKLVREAGLGKEFCSQATSTTSCRGCRRSTSSRCRRTPTRVCPRRLYRRCSSGCPASRRTSAASPSSRRTRSPRSSSLPRMSPHCAPHCKGYC